MALTFRSVCRSHASARQSFVPLRLIASISSLEVGNCAPIVFVWAPLFGAKMRGRFTAGAPVQILARVCAPVLLQKMAG